MLAPRGAKEIAVGVKSLLQHKLRSVLTLLGLVFGVGSVIAMLAVGEGASTQVLEQIRKLGSNNILVDSAKPVEDASAQSQVSRLSIYGLTYADYHRFRETIPGVRRTVPVKLLRQQGQLGSCAMDLRVVGTTPDWFDLVRRPVIAGRVLTDMDLERHTDAVVLTEHGARRLLATRETIGQPVRIGGSFFTVVGIVRSENVKGGSVPLPDREVDAYVPLSVSRARFGDISTQGAAASMNWERVELHQVIIEATAMDQVETAAAAIEYGLKRFHEQGDFRMNVPLALLRQAEATKRTFNIVLGSIAGISLLVGGIGIMNIMLATVIERTREIGIRRAIGARRSQIIRQFLVETVVLSCIGGFLGIALGIFIPRVITRLAGLPTQITPESLVLSLGISAAIGIVFGLYPAVRAARLDPIVALRHE